MIYYAVVDKKPTRGRKTLHSTGSVKTCELVIKTKRLTNVEITRISRQAIIAATQTDPWTVPANLPLDPPGRPGRHRRPVAGLAGQIGQRIQKLREAAGLSMEAAAKRAGVTESGWQKLEQGEKLRTMAAQLEKLSKSLGCEPREIIP